MPGEARLTRQARLLNPREFRRVFEQAQRSSDALFTVLARASGLSEARLGLAISRKAARRAVDRNRIKRQARESFRHRQPELVGLDFVVMAKGGAVSVSNRELRKSLERHWRRLTTRCARS